MFLLLIYWKRYTFHDFIPPTTFFCFNVFIVKLNRATFHYKYTEIDSNTQSALSLLLNLFITQKFIHFLSILNNTLSHNWRFHLVANIPNHHSDKTLLHNICRRLYAYTIQNEGLMRTGAYKSTIK